MSDRIYPPSPDEVETAFHTVFRWVQAGDVESSLGDKPYRWTRHHWQATGMDTSPSGPFKHIVGPGVFVYFRPTEEGFGHMRRFDFRAETNPFTLIQAAEKLSGASDGDSAPSDPVDDPDTWLIRYEDKDMSPELFSGCGATKAARRRFEMQRSAWSCHLFKRIESSV